ncbi:mannosyltransferase [Coemansia pectinata]|uniref:Mannosyltransferase n=1 Tax=Coemansia pectinata TaxID=1052879 RepID=A0A9W8H513_9FUNG|nr:mannosyltransferase [Coemansia pectinata]
MDCDEVFNYWEPLHFLHFGWGKQTWEYAPQYALRSYGYLELHRVLIMLMSFVGISTRIQVFYAVRLALGVGCAFCEAVFVRAVARHVDRRVSNYTLLGLAGMAGMFHSGAALLPSSFAMCWAMLGSAAAMSAPGTRRRVGCAVWAFAVAVVWGWPYSAVVALPFVVEEIVERREFLINSMAMGVGAVAVTAGLAAAIDSWYYGSGVLAGWNQIAYNVLGRGGDSTLYGTEPWYFYVKNGLLNANIVIILAIACLPLWTTSWLALRLAGRRGDTDHRRLLFRVLPFYVALGVFSLQPHKEERFLSIVYPHMCFNAAVSLSLLRPLYSWPRLGYLVLCVAGIVGALRMAALVQYYGAPTHAFQQLPSHMSERVVCMGSDWYRFPSSFWLPHNYRLQFIKSSFDGHLPGDFTPPWISGSTRASTAMRRDDFNSMNRWEPTHAVSSNMTTEAKDLVENQRVIQVNSNSTIEHACDTLIKHDIQSVPLYDQETQTYVGMFDLHDLATYILLKRSDHGAAESDSDSSAVQLQAAAARSSTSGLARDAVMMGKRDSVSLLSDMSHMNPFYSVLPETTLAQVVAVFARGTHRVAVMDGNQIRGILSQTRVIRYFFEHCAESITPSESRLLDTPLRQLGLVTNDVVKVRPNSPVIQALALLERWRISSLAIVDEEDRIAGNLSVADVKYLAKQRRLTSGTCMELVQAARFVQGMRDGRDRAAVFSVRPEATLRYALTKLIATGAHRVWVTEPRHAEERVRSGSISIGADPTPPMPMRRASVSSTSSQTVPIAPQHYAGSFNDKVCGVVSLTDILRLLIDTAPNQPTLNPELNYASMD